MNNEAEPNDVQDQDDRITKVYDLRNELAKRGRIGTYSYFLKFPDSVKELLELAGTSPDPGQGIRWEVMHNLRNLSSHTSFGFELPLSAQHIEGLIIYLRTSGSKKADDEGRLLFFDLKPRGRGNPTKVAEDILARFKDWGRPENEFRHLTLIEDLFQFAQAATQPRGGPKSPNTGLGYPRVLRPGTERRRRR